MFTTLINEESLFDRHEDPDWIIFDARFDLMDKHAGKKAYQQGHIPGAIYVDLHDDLSRSPSVNGGRHPLPTVETMRTLFSELNIRPEIQVIVYDDTAGAFAARMWWMLKHMRHEKVAVLDGGWQAWLAADRAISAEKISRVTGEFRNDKPSGGLIKIEEVDTCDLLIDSRDPARYRGEIEPIDKAAGHIPGAINRFWKENLTADGVFKSKRQLKQEFDAIFAAINAEDAVFYCGSGVTACHNLLAVAHAGMKLPKLYAGSWSEWSSTPGKPIATEA